MFTRRSPMGRTLSRGTCAPIQCPAQAGTRRASSATGSPGRTGRSHNPDRGTDRGLRALALPKHADVAPMKDRLSRSDAEYAIRLGQRTCGTSDISTVCGQCKLAGGSSGMSAAYRAATFMGRCACSAGDENGKDRGAEQRGGRDQTKAAGRRADPCGRVGRPRGEGVRVTGWLTACLGGCVRQAKLAGTLVSSGPGCLSRRRACRVRACGLLAPLGSEVREFEFDLGALFGRVYHRDVSFVRLGDGAHDREPEPRAA